MRTFTVLNAGVPSERAQWIDTWSSWASHEVSAHPGYVELFTHETDTALCAIMSSTEGTVLFPFILRHLSSESWVEPGDTRCDLVSPYGYGGPFAWGEPSPREFWADFDDWAGANQLVCSFVRFSLFPEQLIPFSGTVEDNALNVVRVLDPAIGAVWLNYDHKVRKNVNKAQRNGLKVDIDLDGQRLDDFLAVYYSTLERRNALAAYYFSPAFFRKLVNDLYGQFVFFHTLHKERVVSTELVLVSVDHIYSFLGGTLRDAFYLRPNELLKHTIIEWGKDQGKRTYVLGGGYSGQDGIFHYKLSFAPQGQVPFRVGKRIYDPVAYERLIQLRRRWEFSQGRQWQPRDGYFPTYRA